MGKTLAMDGSFLTSSQRLVAIILVELDERGGLYESLNLVANGKTYTHTLDYLNIPFRCLRCHFLGNILENYDKTFSKNVWVKKQSLVASKVQKGNTIVSPK